MKIDNKWNKGMSPTVRLAKNYIEYIYDGDLSTLSETDIERAFYAGMTSCIKAIYQISNMPGPDATKEKMLDALKDDIRGAAYSTKPEGDPTEE